MSFNEINITEEKLLPFSMLSKDWFLITAGNDEKINTMTAGWGGMGVMWAKSIFLAAVRTSRYTYGFIEDNDCFSVSFFDEQHKDILNFCGRNSGRDVDKIKEMKLTPVMLDNVPAFEEAKLVLICKKLYRHPLDESCFIDKELMKYYDKESFHVMYASEIIKAYKKY